MCCKFDSILIFKKNLDAIDSITFYSQWIFELGKSSFPHQQYRYISFFKWKKTAQWKTGYIFLY